MARLARLLLFAMLASLALCGPGGATVVDDSRASHLDPTSAALGKNRFVKTVVPFLRRIPR